MINQNNFFMAEVRDTNDPSKSGKVKIRIYGNHDDEQAIKDDDLPWATVLLPITSASTQKVGHIPTGLIKGSRVFGCFIDDHERQVPLVLGSFYRAAQPSGQDNAGGQEDLKHYGKGTDTPSDGVGEQDAGKTPNNTTLGGTETSKSDDYNKATFVDPGAGPDAISTALSKFAPNGKETTTAGVDPSKDLPDAIAQVGTSGEVLKQLVSKLNAVLGIMKMANPSGSGGGGGSSSPNSSPPTQSGIPETLVQAMTGALTYYCDQYSFLYVLNLLTNTFSNGGFYNLESINQSIMSESILTLMNNFAKYGANNLPYTPTPNWNVIPPGTTTFPSPIVGTGLDGAPTYYVQQYYSLTNDPYPGFIQWEGPTNDFVYTIRDGQPNYASATAAVLDQAQTEFQTLLYPFIVANLLTADDLNIILDTVNTHAQTNGAESALGSGSSTDIMGLAMQLLGMAGSMLNLSISSLPNTVLNVDSMTQTIQKFAKNASIAKQMMNKAEGAFKLPGALSGLSSLGGISSALGSLGGLSSAIGSLGGLSGALSGITGSISGSCLSSALSSFGGVSGALSSLDSLSSSLNSITSIGGSLSSLSSMGSALSSITSLQSALSVGDISTASLSMQILNNSLSSITNEIGPITTTLTAIPGNGLSLISQNTLSTLGLSQSSISGVNTICVNNPSITSNTITTITDISLTLEKANVPESEILTIQLLLSEILGD